MKINAKIFNSLKNEPIAVQDVNGTKVEIHYMNDTPYLQQYVSRGRFYLWTSNGNEYKLLVEKGFYEKVDYFFVSDINGIWISFLDEVGKINSKLSKVFLGISLLVTLLVIAITAIFFNEQLMIGVIIALFATLVINMVQTTKINKIVREKNLAAQDKIRTILTEEGFNRLLKEQDEYMKEYFKFDEEENVSEEILEDENNEIVSKEVEEIEVVEEKEEK